VLLSVISASQSTAAVDAGDIGVWEELGRSSTIASGAITVSGLTLTDMVAIRVLLLGLTVTTDDSTVLLRFLVSGSEVSTGYRWALRRNEPAGGATTGSTSDSSIQLADVTATQGVGNASTESFGALLTVPGPASSLFKTARGQSTYLQPDASATSAFVGGLLENTGPITGVKVFGSSDLTAGQVIVLGLD
jgi:hypothetical protein